MATTADYLTQLQTDKTNLINKLKDKGVAVEDDATFTDLPDKIDDIGESRLPSGYQEVEYIESDGTNQYISTGIVPNQDTSIEIKIEIKDTKLQFLYGARDGSSTNSYAALYASQKYRFDYANGMNTTSKTYSGSPDIIYQNKNEVYLNNELILTADYSEFAPSRATGGIYLFNVNTAGSIGTSDTARFAAMKIYYCKIWQGDTLVRYLVPAYRKSDNMIGMFDLKNDAFYNNLGAAQFTKGQNVNIIPLEEKEITINGEYEPETGNVGFSKVTVNVNGDAYKLFNGSFDVQGLKTIGWTDDDIKFANDTCVTWNSYANDIFKLTETELAGDDSSNTRFLPKNTTKKAFPYYSKILTIPKIDISSRTVTGSMFGGCTSLLSIPQLDTSNVTNMTQMFWNCNSLITIPQLNTSKVTNMYRMFEDCASLASIPELDTSNVTDIRGMFESCNKLIVAPQLNTSKVTSMNHTFCDCHSLTTIPQLDTSKVTDMGNIFENCQKITTIPQIDTSNVTYMYRMFSGCSLLTSIPELNTSKVTSMNQMFSGCQKLTTIPQLDTSKVTDMGWMFNRCSSLTTVPQLDASKVTCLNAAFSYCTSLITLGGLKNLGGAYSTTQSANYSYYTLDLNNSTDITYDSLMNVINNLYDIATKGCKTQKLSIGSTNLAKLTADEIAIATAKGWTVA